VGTNLSSHLDNMWSDSSIRFSACQHLRLWKWSMQKNGGYRQWHQKAGAQGLSSVSNGSKFPGWFHCNWAGFTSKTRHFNTTSLTPSKYLSSDRIMTWSICKLYSFVPSFTSRFRICDRTTIHWVAIENPRN
jgi:hypothetical protein